MTKVSDEDRPEPHDYCSVNCRCGHWRDRVRRATTNADGRRGRVTLDVVEGNDDGSR